MTDLLLPETDAGVAVQTALVALVAVAVIVGLRRRPEARLVAVGAALIVVGLVGLRALH